MNLQTVVEIPRPRWQIEHGGKVMLLGSCFADEMSEQFVRGGFQVLANPFGTLYNPASIATMLRGCIDEKSCDEVFEDKQGIWHSWMHHTRFSSATKEDLQSKVDEQTRLAGGFLREADVLIVTLGTAIIYRLKENGMLVANCHKQPDTLFVRERLTVNDIAEQWVMLLGLLKNVNPKLKVILTVSPIRHKRDGMHINNISKGILLEAVDAVCQQGESVEYFPSYEIMMDELRDYRFYAADMIHPSEVAVKYIWERFQDAYFSAETRESVRKANKEYARGLHKAIV